MKPNQLLLGLHLQLHQQLLLRFLLGLIDFANAKAE
jgi:hypothetical protein